MTENWLDKFLKRTHKHIESVNQYARKLNLEFPNHDKDKLTTLLDGYSLMMKDGITEAEQKQIDLATFLHITKNGHHPEHWTSTDISGFGRFNTNPHGIIEAKAMPKDALIEMCCDWCAMSKEFGNSPFEWFAKVNGIRWQFTEAQEEIILSTLEELWSD